MKWKLPVSTGLEPETDIAKLLIYSISQNSHKVHLLDERSMKEFVAFFNLHIWYFQRAER